MPHGIFIMREIAARVGGMTSDNDQLPVPIKPTALHDPDRPRSPSGAGADRRRRPSRLALHRLLHRQHPQPEHAPGLRAGLQPVLRLVRRSRPDADDDPAVRCRHIYRDTPADPFAAGREAAARRRAHAVRLADHRPGGAGQPGLGRARPEACGEDRQDAGARRQGMAQTARRHPDRHGARLCATGR